MTAVGVWESRGPDTGVIGDDRPRDFQRAGGARLADLQIQRDVDRASPGRALPQRPVDTAHGPATAVRLAKPKASRVPVSHHFPECFQLNYAPLRNGTQAPAPKPVTP